MVGQPFAAPFASAGRCTQALSVGGAEGRERSSSSWLVPVKTSETRRKGVHDLIAHLLFLSHPQWAKSLRN